MGKSNTMYGNNGRWDVINTNMINKYIKNAQKRLLNQPLEEVYQLKFKGYTFNVLPFLLNGMEFYDSENSVFEAVRTAFANKKIENIDTVKKLMNEDSLLDIKMFEALIPSYTGHLHRDLGAHLHVDQPYVLVGLLYASLNNVLLSFVSGAYPSNLTFNYKEICNTQAFSFLIGIEWFLQKTPEVRAIIQKQLTQFKYHEIVHSLCPEECLHMKYIKGEINAEELVRLYKREHYSDNSSICQREIMSLYEEGRYDGRDLSSIEQELCEGIYFALTNDKINIVELNFAASFYPKLDYWKNKAEEETKRCDAIAEEKDNIKQRMQLQRESVVKLKDEIKDLENENLKLRTSLSQIQTNEELLKRIAELEEQNDFLEKENSRLFNERGELKQLISAQKKQLRIVDSIKNNDIDNDKNIDNLEEVVEEAFDFDKAVSLLKDKSYMLIGAYDVSTIDANFEKYGFTNVKRFKFSTRTLGNCDCVIIFTQKCGHDEVRTCESLAKNSDVEFVYVNNYNFEMIIKTLYDSLC